MGNRQTTSKEDLAAVRSRAVGSLPAVQVTGRYHTGKRLEDDYSVSNSELGTGYNGSVFLATSKDTHEKFAVKPYKLFRISKAQKRELRNEVEVFLSMDHPHVARLRDVYECETMLRLVMECLEGGELFDRIAQRKKFNEVDAAVHAYQMLLAVNYLHSRGIVHRDIKPENFLYDSMRYDHLKLIDFGFSRFTQNKRMKLGCGTLAYMAPEVVNGDSYDNKCDMWSMGVVVFILVSGYMPFSGKGEDLITNIRSGRLVVKQNMWEQLSERCRDFIGRLIQADVGMRMSSQQALDHPWISERESDERAPLDNTIIESLADFTKSSHFRRTCMSMMAWRVTNEDRARVRKAFMEVDQDKSGTITLCELKRILEEKGCVVGADAQQVFDALDFNSNEEVQYSEFLAAMMSTHITMHDETVISTFKRFDTDNTGFITAQNLMQILGSCVSQCEAEKMLQEADVNLDGKISQQEFMDYIHCRAPTGQLEVFGQLIENEKTGHQKAIPLLSPRSRTCVLL